MCQLRVAVLLLLGFITHTRTSQYGEVPQYLQSKYGPAAPPPSPYYGGTKTYTKTKTKTVPQAGGAAQGGCVNKPPPALNAGIRCSQYSGCRYECLPDHQFPNGATQLFVTCIAGVWELQGTQWTTAPSCQPICVPACQNSGMCVSPNQCNCPDNFSGPQCQFETRPCLNHDPMPLNAKRTCNSKTCTITCLLGHQFPDGASIMNTVCKNGVWTPAGAKWPRVPDCEPTCNPPCVNGGNCLSFNVCQCPQDFRGAQCQHRADNCHPKKLLFNGGYNCSGDGAGFGCSLRCPDGVKFEFAPVGVYRCLYETGEFQPTPIPQCVFPGNMQVLPGSSSQNFYHSYNASSTNQGYYGSNIEIVPIQEVPQQGIVFVESKLPTSGVCFTWQGTHYKTFDSKIFSFESKCPFTLVRDAVDNTFAIIVQNNPICSLSPALCSKIIKVYYQANEYVLEKSMDGTLLLKDTNKKRTIPIPGQVPGLRTTLQAHYIVLSLDTVSLRLIWDGALFLQVEVKENLWQRTEGLCGQLDGNEANDVVEKSGRVAKSVTNLASSWQVDNLDEVCNDLPEVEQPCGDPEALNFCQSLLNDVRFASCRRVLDADSFLDACRWDYCSCSTKCACDTMDAFIKACAFAGVPIPSGWRTDKLCPMLCPSGKQYRTCAPPNGQEACGSITEIADGACIEGCYCPDGTAFHNSTCIPRDECPCKLRGNTFPSGAQIPKDCNTCTCQHGKWQCTQISCGARCAAVGDPHYATFDGRKYDFMGQCSYYLVKTPSFSIEAENVACAGSISAAMHLPASLSSGLPACTKTVTVRHQGHVIHLKQNHELVVDGLDVTAIPHTIAGTTIRAISSIFLQAALPNGVEVWWDGASSVFVDIPPGFPELTTGLCGSFNNNQKDDFLTPDGDVESATVPFANKWKTSEQCGDVPAKLRADPCTINIHKRPMAEEHCAALTSKLFAPCHWILDPVSFYQDCLFDVCSCEHHIAKCLCQTVAAYAGECARRGVRIEWRNAVRECGVTCPSGQKYRVCGNTCTRTCLDISLRPDCRPQCVEGCNCPDGEAIDETGECVPIGRCKCQQDGIEFQPGYKEVRPASKGPELCTCLNARWSCRRAHAIEINKYPKAKDVKSLCAEHEHLVFTTCESVEPVTCRNMHQEQEFTTSVCHAGCKCAPGFVLDSSTKKCVRPTDCPCHHGGRSYKENATVKVECNTCRCRSSKWECSKRSCAGECSLWGDSHFRTFDGKPFDYQGQCEYVLAKGSLDTHQFDVSVEDVACGTLGTSCARSLTVRLKASSDQDTITLSQDKQPPAPATLKHALVRKRGLFTIVEAPDFGVVVQWDQGTRVYVRAEPRWKGQLKGLCGNYNGDESDDFQTPSGGMVEVSARIFGDSWQLQAYCPEAQEVRSACEERPERKAWALKQCGVLKTRPFAKCHSAVSIDHYFEKCVFDSCACDEGGDCHCLCTALAAYAQECNNHGVAVKWRSQQLCPMQCNERCSSYSPCISTCELETCANLASPASKTCKEETCIEGCAPKPCPAGEIYLNSSYLECVPRNVCRPICMEEDEIVYYEGDLVEEDACHRCFCSRGHKVCKGHPCPTSCTNQSEQMVQCTSGWSDWINQDKAMTKTKSRGKKSDFEPLPSSLLLSETKGGKCEISQMTGIECRTVKTHLTPKETMLDVECSLEKGLICESGGKGKPCKDFEIRVFCQCEPATTPAPVCDPSHPHKEYPNDCHKFYHCEVGPNGAEAYVEKTCGPSMYYNPVSMTCDWPYAVAEIKPECKKYETTTMPETAQLLDEPPECPDGQTKESCAIKCTNLCLYYAYAVKKAGKCLNNEICDADCVSKDRQIACPDGHLWASNETCVSLHDCACRSYDNKPVKPGTVYRESDCKVCQCINNFYVCDDSACHTTTPTPATKPDLFGNNEILFVPTVLSTVTPPDECRPFNYIDLVQGDQPLPDGAFNASSSLSTNFQPSYSRFKTLGPSWSPLYSDMEQYLDIDLGQQNAIYGIRVKGSSLYDEYVTSYKVFYSPDGGGFLPVLNKERLPQIFKGSLDALTPVEQIFDVPFEAQIVRINPQTWQNSISLKVELIGCGEVGTTTPDFEWIATTPQIEFCQDSMGLDEGTLSPQQVAVSSELNKNCSKYHLKITGTDTPWQPLTNSPTEYVQFDFLEARNVTGLVTKGGPGGWVTAYVVRYSHDGTTWNPIIDPTTAKDHVFLGNSDGKTANKNVFQRPISTRLIQIVPTKWERNIQMRVEIYGCYKPYPYVEEVATTLTPCNLCPGVDGVAMEMGACHCSDTSFWNGMECVTRDRCPCIYQNITYQIGALFQKEDCTECLCKLGGATYCHSKKCPACKPGLRSTVTATCKCTCQSCPFDTRLCPTSNICIDAALWCNGVQDCPDDESDCLFEVFVPKADKPSNSPVTPQCVAKECPPGYIRREIKQQRSYLSPMFSTNGRKAPKKTAYTKSSATKSKKTTLPRPKLTEIDSFACPEYSCTSEKPPPKLTFGKQCPPVSCPPDYTPFQHLDETINVDECPSYTCYPAPPPAAVCNVTGRTISTFDLVEYKYDICNHVIARDVANDEWDISLRQECNDGDCTRALIINHNDNNLVIHQNQTIEFDGFPYTIDQTKQIGTQTQDFSMTRLGNSLLFVSNRYGFYIIWDEKGNVRVGVVRKLIGTIDGLCGYFNEMSADDKRKPDGSVAKSTVEFGDSWANNLGDACQMKTCPLDSQKKAWDVCNRVKDQVLAPCAKIVDIEAFISRCLETTCACLAAAQSNYSALEKCRCDALQDFVVDCLAGAQDTELPDWRMQLDCPVSCEAPLVHHDCYRRKCEPTCESVHDPSVCPKLPNVCFPGCYCPPGFVKKGETCIRPSNCRDCECNVLPHLQYVSYDNAEFTVNGNCVYVMSRDAVITNHVFQVLITNAPCRTNEEKTCVGKVTILYEGHKIHVLNNMLKNKLRLVVDGERIDDIDSELGWGKVRETSTKHYKILLTSAQVEVSVYYPSLGVSVKAPSHRYGSKLEGLCGNCNKNPNDDMVLPSGAKAADVDDFAVGWLYEKLPGGQSKELCHNPPEVKCDEIAPELDACSQILDYNKFGQCLRILDPSLFVEWCKKDTCNNHPELSCTAIEAFARDCASAGFCVNWRTKLCPAKACASDQIYGACGSSCPPTCEDLKVKKVTKKCSQIPVEGCFCPEGKLLRNQTTCVVPEECEVCDDQGHKPGDRWNRDKCTKCTCDGIVLKCETEHCSNSGAICAKGYQTVRVPGTEDDCCDKFACLPEPTMGPTCEPPQKLICGPGQVLKLDTKPNGCQQFICECKPYDECDSIETTKAAPLEAGYERLLDETGCCPILKLICNPKLCPAPQPCDQYYTLKNETTSKCCPLYTCVPPKNKCIYEALFTESKEGGERARTSLEKQKFLKTANSTWKDGPCRECRCEMSSLNNYQAICGQIECAAIETSQDYLEYELEPLFVYGQCCPNIRRVACKMGGQSHGIGEKWSMNGDYCTTFECVNATNGVQKETNVEKCSTSCELGAKYFPSDSKCCGECRPVACVCEGIVHQVGDEWHSPDFCTNYYCLNVNGSMQIQSVLVNCPTPPDDYSANFVYETIPVEGDCCKKYQILACKVGTAVYHTGESWPSPDGDKCKKYTCTQNEDGDYYKQESVESCKQECPKGWEYQDVEEQCCGECVQTTCVVDNELRMANESWFSDDNCTTFSCDEVGGQFLVSSSQETCPELENCPEEMVYVKGCCKRCNLTEGAAQSACGPEPMPLNKTIGMFRKHEHIHGICVNKKAIDGFNECIGSCHSSTNFNFKSSTHENVCSCCQATDYRFIEVEMECDDGSNMIKKVAVPSACRCEGCANSKSPIK